MLYLIADIKTKVPATGGLDLLCQGYKIDGNDDEAEIVIDESKYNYDYWKNLDSSCDDNLAAYMESGFQFYVQLLNYDGLMLHASATVIDGEVYLFAGQSGIGKSTHANLLLKLFPNAQLINDDKPALRCVDGKWFAYGTPWSGKNYININSKFPIKAICLLSTNRDKNDIRLAQPLTAISGLIACSAGRATKERVLKLTSLIDRLIKDVPVYEMDSLADDNAAILAYNVMSGGRNEN